MHMHVPYLGFSFKWASRSSFFTSSILNNTKISENIKGVNVGRGMFGLVRVDRFFGECKVRLDLKNQVWN